MPFKEIPLSGGKLRQAICLINDNYEYIKNECEGTVITATSINSPQGIIVTRVAKEFGFKSILVVGATTEENLKNNKLMQRALGLGASIDCETGMGFESALMSRIDHLCSHNNYFVIKFGINLFDNPKAIVDSISHQVQNLPKDLDVLVVNIGSGITFGGILKGLERYKIYPKRIIGVQIAGYDRTETINRIAGGTSIEYDYIADKTYPYSRKVKAMINKKEYLDPVYEAKAFHWMVKNIDYKNNKTLFWIVGNSIPVRK